MVALTKVVLHVIKLLHCFRLGLEGQKRRQAQNQGEQREK